MRICDLATGLGELSHAFGQLKEGWSEAKLNWSDDTNRQFEQNHLRTVPAQLQLMISAVDRLAQMVEKAERECSDRGDE